MTTLQHPASHLPWEDTISARTGRLMPVLSYTTIEGTTSVGVEKSDDRSHFVYTRRVCHWGCANRIIRSFADAVQRAHRRH